MRLLLKSLLAVILLAILSSCESEPVEIGQDLIPDSDKLKLVKVSSDSLNWDQYAYAYPKDSLNLASSRRILLGQFDANNDSYSIKSHCMIYWYISLDDSLIKEIKNDEVVVKSAWMTLKPVYNKMNYNDLNFSIHRINEYWDASHFYYENLEALDYNSEDSFVDFFDNDSTQGKTDSLISFHFSNDLAESWLKVKADTSLPDKNYGVLLSPNGMTNNIGFYSANVSIANFNPAMYIEVLRTIDSTGFQYADTVSSTLVLSDTHVNEVINTITYNKDSRFVLHTGVPNLANFFIDVSAIPSNAVINSAELFFTCDTANSQYADPRSDTLYVIAIEDSVTQKITSLAGALYNVDGIYSGSITSIIQNWVRGAENHGIAVTLSDDERSVSRVELFNGNVSNPALKPKVEIVYTTIPGQ